MTPTVGVIGLGAMGRLVAGRLECGYDVYVWNRTIERAQPLVEDGACLARSPAALAAAAPVVITLLADHSALRSVVEGDDGLAASGRAGSVLVDMSTVGPDGIAYLLQTLPEGVALLDAPVLADRFGGRHPIYVAGATELQAEVSDAGVQVVSAEHSENVTAVLVGAHRGFDYAELRSVCTAVLRGAELYSTGLDHTYPTEDGPAPATGAIISAIESATAASARNLGKPEPAIFVEATKALVGCQCIAVVGDQTASDVVGARRAGLAAVLVLSGATRAGDPAIATTPADVVVDDIWRLAELMRCT